MPDSLWLHGLQHTRLPCLSPTPRASSNSYPLSQWCHPAISSSVISFSSCLQSFPASGSFLRSQFFTPVGQGIRASISAQSYQWLFKIDFLAIQGSLKSLLQHYSSKASILQHLAFFKICSINRQVSLSAMTQCLRDLSSLTRVEPRPEQRKCRILTSGPPGNSIIYKSSCKYII